MLSHFACSQQQTGYLLRFIASKSHGNSSRSYQIGAWHYAAVAGLAGLLSLDLVPVAHGDAADSNSVPEDVRRQRFHAWMVENGGDWSAAQVQPCKDPEAGLGLFATPGLRHHMSHSWLGRRLGSLLLRGTTHQTVPVAAVPLNLTLTADSARKDPELGPVYAELMDLGLLDERNAVIVMLLVEKMRGATSRYAPYIDLLPQQFATPLWFDEQQLAELSGTTLSAATAARQASLSRSWDKLQPAVTNMLKQVGVFSEPTLDDFKWANSVFWSRGLGLPVPVEQQLPDGSAKVHIETLEGLVPGLDFANHSQQARCWWEVVEQKQQQLKKQQQQQQQIQGGQQAYTQEAQPGEVTAAAEVVPSYAVQLLTNRACCPKAGEELTISYGDKGNEELLLLYGFTQQQNPNETLMLLCPLPPPDDWDDVFTARMQLLQARGLTPQLFLSASHLANYQQAEAAKLKGNSRSSNGSRSRTSSVLPAAARDVLEVFVMQKSELFKQMQLLGMHGQEDSSLPPAASPTSSSSSNSTTSSNGGDLQDRKEALGMSMAVLTTLMRLLELRVTHMEGEEGTGPLEDDLRRLAEDAAIKRAQQQQQQQHTAAGMPAWLHHCLVYRAGQKALAREYLTAARKELQETLAQLQALMDAAGEYQE